MLSLLSILFSLGISRDSLLLFFNHEGILPSASLSYMYLGFQESKISIQCTWSRAITGNASKKRICPNRLICLLKCAIRKLPLEEGCSGVPNRSTNG